MIRYVLERYLRNRVKSETIFKERNYYEKSDCSTYAGCHDGNDCDWMWKQLFRYSCRYNDDGYRRCG